MEQLSFKKRLLDGTQLVGTFQKTPSHVVTEVLALAGVDFICLDAEHAPFDRGAIDACVAMGRALDVPMLVRVASAAPDQILNALDCGAVGVVVPHVDTVADAEAVARAARFGRGGRGFAGSTRWAGYATRSMADVLSEGDDALVFAQIEDPDAVEAASGIAAVSGIDALFLGPADLSVAYGKSDQSSDELRAAFATVGKAAEQSGKGYATFVPTPAQAADAAKHGVSVFFVASEHAWLRQGAVAALATMRSTQGTD